MFLILSIICSLVFPTFLMVFFFCGTFNGEDAPILNFSPSIFMDKH